ncbi:hypothetical protein JK359_16270 [Streptomyces actinomycinicus]|uniref:Lipoprotein n=1 Tax=Streptomyces actinomycinicus TaxID=1695166 RepID=A0A937EK25_9ACTN|nr:hypothetical protein [Streptomyces actinomycinicus]MBL1083510.1 hypothetical protein [Streptomyces actinomycinicus]
MRHTARATTLIAVCCLGLTACTASDDRSTPEPSQRAQLRLRQSAGTAGAGGKGTMRITPDTVVYVRRAGNGTPEHDLYAVVAFTSENRSEFPVTATTRKGGFRWKASNGHTVGAGNSISAARIAPTGFSDGGPTVSAGTFRRNTVAFDITTAEKGGTLIYLDGNGDSCRWTIPPTNSGSTVSALRIALT